MPIVDSIYTKIKRALVGVGVVVRTSAASALADDPTISSGSGAPSGSEPNGSVYLRTNGATYVRTGGAWVLVPALGATPDFTSAGIKADVIAESTAAAGVDVDGCLIKDGRAEALATGAMFLSTEQTGTGSSQNVAHGFGATPTVAVVLLSELDAGLVGGADIAYGTHTSTNVVVTVTSGLKFYVLAIK